MRIRTSQAGDRQAIAALHAQAFGPEEGPEIASLVDDLFADSTARPLLSLVADEHGVIGHVLFTPVRLPGHPDVPMQILAPLAVARSRQGEGIGSALVRDGLARLTASGTALVFVLGHPGYYARFGFRPAGARGLDAPYPIPAQHADAWMVQALGHLPAEPLQGRVRCATALDQPRHWCEPSEQ